MATQKKWWWNVFWWLLLIIILVNATGKLPKGVGFGIFLFVVVLVNMVKSILKKRWTTIQKVFAEQGDNVLKRFVEEIIRINTLKADKLANRWKKGNFFKKEIKQKVQVQPIKKESMWWPSRKDESYSTSTVWWKDILWRKVNPMSLNGK